MSPNALDAWTAAKLQPGRSDFTRSELAQYQLQRLAETLAWARQRSPFYRRALADFSAPPATLADLRGLPFTTAEDLRRNDPPLPCVSQSDISRVVTLESSGTSGAPKRLFFTEEDQEATIDYFHHGMSLLAGPGDRVLVLFPGERPGSVGNLLMTALTRLGAAPILGGWVRDAHATAELAAREKVNVVAGPPVPILAVARQARAGGVSLGPIKSVLLSSDHAAKSLVRGLEKLWGCAVFEHYGMTEMGLGGGVQCAAHDGYHLREHELLFEVVDPASGEPVAEGEFGEVVFTTLNRRGMPLVRYRTGDISRFLPGPCACGSPLRRLDRVTRRVAAVAIGTDTELTMGVLDEPLLSIAGVSDFTASVRRGPPAVLRIELAQPIGAPRDGRGDDALIRVAKSLLGDVPTIRRAMAQGDLQLDVDVRPEGVLCPHGAKRTIAMDVAP